MAGQGTARALTMLEIRMTLDSINRWLKAIQSGHHILQHELERQFKSRPNHRQILYELAQQQLITPVVFRHLLALADDSGTIQSFSPVASMLPKWPDGVKSTAATASVIASIHNQGVASSPSTTTTPPPPAAVQASTTPASNPAAATRSASISEVDHGAANVVPCVDVPLTTKSSATCSTYVLIGTPEGYVADAVPLVSGPQHVVAKNKEDDPDAFITDVGEQCVEPGEMVFSESHLMELDDEVFTYVGALSLFLEEGLESAAAVFQNVFPCNGNSFSPGVVHKSAAIGILLSPDSNRALINNVYQDDSLQAWEIQYELQNFVGSISRNADRKHRMVQLLSKNIYSVQRILDLPMQKVTHSSATLWDPGIFAVHFIGHLNLLGSDAMLCTFISAMRLCGRHGAYIQSALQEMLLFCWKSQLSISWGDMLAWLFSLLFAPGQCTGFRSFLIQMVHVVEAMPLWRRRAFGPGQSGIASTRSVLAFIQPWKHGFFNPSAGVAIHLLRELLVSELTLLQYMYGDGLAIAWTRETPVQILSAYQAIALHTPAMTYMFQEFWALIVLATNLQHKTWDPGVQSIEVSAPAARDACARGSSLLSLHCRNWCYIVLRLRHEQAIAWGQAMFPGGDSVTPVPVVVLGLADMGRGPAILGLFAG
jgi:hypothetical protein